jgi:hypothetical protein
MKTRCNQKTFDFQTQNSRKIVAHFNGGNITSDAGGLLLQQAERVTGIISQFADRTSAATMRANQLRYRGNRSLQQDTRPRQQPFQPSLTRKNSSKSESVRTAG